MEFVALLEFVFYEENRRERSSRIQRISYMLKKAGVRFLQAQGTRWEGERGGDQGNNDLCPQLALGPSVSTSTAGDFSLSCQGSVECTEDCLGTFTEEQNLFVWLPPSFYFY